MSQETRASSRESFKGIVAVGDAATTIGSIDAHAAGPAATETPAKYSWENPPPPISPNDIKEAVQAEVVVVGAGASGVCAALSAQQAGAKTVMLQKGAGVMTHGVGIGVIGSRLQKNAGVEIDDNALLNEIMLWSGNKPNFSLLKLWAERSGETMDWILDITEATGIKALLLQTPSGPSMNRAPCSIIIVGKGRPDMAMVGVAAAIVKNCVKAGVDIHYDTPAVQLIRERKGRVTGVIGRTKEGEYKRFNATKGVVLCTGDYSNDTEMVAKYASWAVGVANGYKPRSNTGDGHKMALWVGAAMEEAPHAPMIHYDPAVIPEGDAPMSGVPWLWVNILGERFENEDVPYPYIANGDLRQPGRMHWQIFDAKWHDELPKMGEGVGRSLIFGKKPVAVQLDEAVDRGAVLKADTMEELARKAGIPVNAFKATVYRYNQLARAGKDLDFGKAGERMTTLEKSPFYAAKRVPGVLAIVGGIKVNNRLQALDTDSNVIPGLYAAGNVSGDFFAVDYPLIVGGISLGRAVTFGRVAGQNAAEEKP